MNEAEDLGFLHGLRTVPRAIALLREMPSVLRLLLIPLVLTALLDAAAFYTSYGYLHALLIDAVPKEGLWIAVRGVLSVLVGGVVVFALAFTFSLVYVTLCELVVDSVSEAVEHRLTGQQGSAVAFHSRLQGLLQSLLQSLLLAGVGLLLLVLSVVPLVGPILAVLLSVASLGYSFFSISAGRKSKTLMNRWELARAHRSAVMGLGVPVFLANLIPLGNLLLLPVFVVAGTLLFLDIDAKQQAATPSPPST